MSSQAFCTTGGDKACDRRSTIVRAQACYVSFSANTRKRMPSWSYRFSGLPVCHNRGGLAGGFGAGALSFLQEIGTCRQRTNYFSRVLVNGLVSATRAIGGGRRVVASHIAAGKVGRQGRVAAPPFPLQSVATSNDRMRRGMRRAPASTVRGSTYEV